MKHFKSILFSMSVVFMGYSAQAQKITLTKGGQTASDKEKGTEPLNFISNGDHYFMSKYFAKGIMNFELRSFDGKGQPLTNKKLEVSVGSFNNSFGIDDIAGMSTKVYALVEHLDKPSGKNTMTARAMDNRGNIAENGVDVMSFPFEKTMNSGFNTSSVSPDAKTLAVVGELPFEKEQPAKFKIAVYDEQLKKLKEGEITLPGENTKNKNMTPLVANDGTVYLIKKTMTKKGETTLAVYQWSAGADVKEYTLELTPPLNIFTYTYTVNSANEFIVCGTTYERKTFTAGDKQAVGIFYFTNKGKTEKLFKTFNLDAPVDNLTARKILINGNTVFLAAEQYKEERISAPPATAGTAASFDYNYDYTHQSEYIIAMDAEGNKKFQLPLAKNFKARDFDKPYYAGYYIVNGKLIVIYNDQTMKYIKNDSYYQNQVAVLVQITNDGLMQPPVVFKNELKLDQYYALYPSVSVQDSANQLSFLMGNNEYLKFLSIKID
jgi:hypothetical protein